MNEEGLDEIILKKFSLNAEPADLGDWKGVVESQLKAKNVVKLKMVGKYMDLSDAYKSLNEALIHAGIRTFTQVDVEFIDSVNVEADGVSVLEGADAILVPGGFGERGF